MVFLYWPEQGVVLRQSLPSLDLAIAEITFHLTAIDPEA